MSKKPININTATKDELMTITDIGETRPGMIKGSSELRITLVDKWGTVSYLGPTSDEW